MDLDLAFTLRNYRKNRTIVSDDIEGLLIDLGNEVGIEPTIIRYPTGSDIGTWIVPQSWNVNEAWIKDGEGNVIASYDEHPLFLVPYSKAFEGVVSKSELAEHVRVHPKRPDDFFYEHRFAYNYPLRLSDWAVTLPANRFEALPDGDYHVKIDLDIHDGDMLIGRYTLPGSEDKKICLLTDYCHPGQVNDSWSGILAMIDVMKRLHSASGRRYTYELLVFPETIGSCVYLESRPEEIAKTELAIFSEFVGWGRNWKVLCGRQKDDVAGRIARAVLPLDPDFKEDEITNGYGNDELIYDYVGIPAMSVQMTECDEYHSSADAPEKIEPENIQKASDFIFSLCHAMEKNGTYRFKQRVPIYMTRFDLYADCINDKQYFNYNRAITYAINEGRSLLDISLDYDVPYDYVLTFVDKLLAQDLIERQ